MAERIYKLDGKLYSETDLSEVLDDYAGDLYDLYWELKQKGQVSEATYYYADYCPERFYESPEEMIEDCYECLLWEGADNGLD